MNIKRIIKVWALALPLVLASCGTKKAVVEETAPVKTVEQLEKAELLQRVNDNNYVAQYLTSKVKFRIQMGNQDMTLTGNLKIKRDDVIRLQLMAFGFVEAGRLEFTKDYVLIQDRINKQYIKAAYNELAFLRNSGITFYTLQSLFWNELFQPGKDHLTSEDLQAFTTQNDGEDVIITYANNRLDYKWLANHSNSKLDLANICYRGVDGNTQLNWGYSDFRKVGKQNFPGSHSITFTNPEKEVKLDITLNYRGQEANWETRTEVKSQYKEVKIDDILRRFMSL